MGKLYIFPKKIPLECTKKDKDGFVSFTTWVFMCTIQSGLARQCALLPHVFFVDERHTMLMSDIVVRRHCCQRYKIFRCIIRQGVLKPNEESLYQEISRKLWTGLSGL